MTSPMAEGVTLTEFLLARLDEQHDHAQPLGPGHLGDPWMVSDSEAKRRIVADHKMIVVWPDGTAGAKYYTGSKRVCASCDERMPVPCRTLQHLAAIYADHPDFDESWRV